MIKIILLAILLVLVGCQETPSQSATDAGDKATSETERNKEHSSNEEEIDQNHEAEDQEQVDDNEEEQADDQNTDDASSEEQETDTTVTPENSVEFVKDHIQAETGGVDFNYFYDGEADDGRYRVQVFEVVTHENGDTHTATYDWFLVDPETGEVTSLFDE